jgi:hypothetical protein
MNRSLVTVLLLSLPAAATLRAADEVSLVPQQAVLLLNNGQLLEGTITMAGDRYDVVGNDSEIRVKRSEVAALCRDREECYRHKRAGIDEGRVQDHLELAEWCLKHALVESAETELKAARAADPSHPRIRLLEPRLELARQAPVKRESAAQREKPGSPEQLDSMVRSLPSGAMERYTNGIQPMLLNYCTKSGCHGPRGSGVMRLERISVKALSGRHSTQANLQSVLAMIDRDSPKESKLLAAPIRPHGGLRTPIFTDREHIQYKQLVEWVYMLANAKSQPAEPSLDEHGAPLLQTVGNSGHRAAAPPQKDKMPQPEASGENPSDWSDSFPDHPKGSPGARSAASRGRRSDQLGPRGTMGPATGNTFVPRDPFDPEIFNRRFFGE